MTEATAGPAQTKAGLWEDFIDIFYQPSQVFERRRDGKFGLALLALIIVSAILFFALHNGIAPIMDAEMAKQAAAMAAKNPQITPDVIAARQGMMEKFAIVGILVGIPIGVLLVGVLLWLASKLIDAKIALVAALMIATYSWVPHVAEMILNAIQGLVLSPDSITSRFSVQLGPARFLGPDANPFLLAVLGGLDVFSIWTVVLLAIGLATVARVPRSRAAIAAGAVWVVGLLPGLYQALSSG